MNFDRRNFLGASLTGLAAASFGSLGVSQYARADQDKAKRNKNFDSLFLTWQRDPTRTVTVQWIGDSGNDYQHVNYVTKSGKIWQTAKVSKKPFPGTDLSVFRSEIVDLTPGTDYQFQVDRLSPVYLFRTMPAKATDEFRFVSGGDAGTGSAAILSNKMAAQQDPYFVLMGGDLAYDNGRSPKTFLKFLQNYHSAMVDSSGRLIPLVSCLGNHEVDHHQDDKRKGAGSYLSVFDGFFSETSYGVLDIGDYLSLVLMDTGHISPVRGEQTDWLERTLKPRQDHPHVFVAGHVPSYPSYRSMKGKDGHFGTGEEQRNLWCPLFERYNVNVVLEHHDHTFKRSHPLINGMIDPNGVHYLGDGSWGKIRPPAPLESRPYLAKASENYHVTMHQLQGNRRIHLALTETGKVADLFSTVSKRAAT